MRLLVLGLSISRLLVLGLSVLRLLRVLLAVRVRIGLRLRVLGLFVRLLLPVLRLLVLGLVLRWIRLRIVVRVTHDSCLSDWRLSWRLIRQYLNSDHSSNRICATHDGYARNLGALCGVHGVHDHAVADVDGGVMRIGKDVARLSFRQ